MGQASPKLVSWAAKEGRVEDLIYHLNQTGPDGLKPAAGTEKRRSPLHLAAIGGYVQCISVLYDAGANLQARDADGLTALHHATANGHLYAVELFLELGANPELVTRFGVAPIHLATASGHTPMIKMLYTHGVNINIQESWGQTPLMVATQQSRLECMKMLLSLGAEKEYHDREHGNTALHVACTTKDEQTLLILLDAKADVHSVNFSGLSPLGVAIENKFYRGIPLLLEYSARLNTKDWSISSDGLQYYITQSTATPLSLSRLCRVAVRQRFGPSRVDEELFDEVPESLQEYITRIRDDCCSHDDAKRHALTGRTITTGPEAFTKC